MSLRGQIEVIESEVSPTIRLTTDDLKEIRNWKVGQKYEIILKVKQVSLRDIGDNKLSALFEVEKAKA